jgi:hypothetical protein
MLPVLFLGAVLLTGCTGSNGDDAPTVAPTPTSPATATVTATTTVTETVTTTETETATPTGTAPAPAPDAAVPEGAGCTPGSDDLPDGRWYGQVEEVGEGTLEFNLMCWFSGDEAMKAAEEDGRDPQDVTNDYYVRDHNPALRELPWEADAPALHYPTGDPANTQELTMTEWVGLFEAGDVYLNVWLTVEDGEIRSLDEQWVP